jgi:hypothetical protein
MNKDKFRKGDTVLITRKTMPSDPKWGDMWMDGMDKCVGSHGTIVYVRTRRNLASVLPENDHSWQFPLFVLNKVAAK